MKRRIKEYCYQKYEALLNYLYEKCTERTTIPPKKFKYKVVDVYSSIDVALQNTEQTPFTSIYSHSNSENVMKKITLLIVNSIHFFINEQSWLLLVLLGLLTATTSIFLNTSISVISSLELYVRDKLYINCTHSKFECNILYFVYYVLFRLLFCIMAGIAVRYISPQSAGSGLPEMKSILSGVILRRYLSFRTYLAKVLGLIFAISGGLSIGMEGPFVHIAAIIANLLTKAKLFSKIHHNQKVKFQMLSAACGVGISTVFGAPIGGIFFAIEKTTSFLTPSIWKSFIAASIGALVGKLGGEVGFTFAKYSTNFPADSYQFWELFVYILIGVGFGYLGSLWVRFVMLCVHLRKDYKILANTRYIQLLIIGIATAVLIYPLKAFQQDDHTIINNLFDTKARDIAIWETPNMLTNLIMFVIYKFIFTAISLGLPIPCGLYIPVFMIGAALGRLIGEFMMWFSDSIVPGGYAVVGAAAMSAGVTRTFSTSIIVFELTGQLEYFIPVLLATIISTNVGNYFTDGIYESLLEQKNLPFIPTIGQLKTMEDNPSADEIMKKINDTPHIAIDATYNDTVKLLDDSTTISFPVVLSTRERRLLGVISRTGLVQLVEEKDIEFSKLIDPTDIDNPLRLSYSFDSINELESNNVVGEEEDINNISQTEVEGEKELMELRLKYFNSSIQPHLMKLQGSEFDVGPVQILPSTNFSKVHYIFTLLGVSTLYVIGDTGEVVGTISNKEFFDRYRNLVSW